MDDALLPAERKMVQMREQQRVRDTRMFFQVATADQFIATVERITGRTVRAFASATDPDHGVVIENLHLRARARARPRRRPSDALTAVIGGLRPAVSRDIRPLGRRPRPTAPGAGQHVDGWRRVGRRR
jgi:hypothetical protein